MLVTEITKGIRVSVETGYEGRFMSKNGPLYIFTYRITIENLSDQEVQLLGRHWFIYDTGEGPSEVEGLGVVGEQPVIAPGASHTYSSGCHLKASIGAMKGYYTMVPTEGSRMFRVKIPTFQFFATPRLN